MIRVPLVFAFPGDQALAAKLAEGLAADVGDLVIRSFPDGESYVRFLSRPEGRNVTIVASLDRPNAKFLPLLFAAQTAREIGAVSVGIVVPYLPYMRQDRRFNEGESVTSARFAEILSASFDWIVTVDPHLHRWTSLNDIYAIPATVAHASPKIGEWIAKNVEGPLLIGPDEESEQWIRDIALGAGLDYLVLTKRRLGDRQVEIEAGDFAELRDRVPVIVDDLISTARTMITVAGLLKNATSKPPICVGIHGIFADDALCALRAAGVARIATCNTVKHETNAIDVSDLLISACRNHV